MEIQMELNQTSWFPWLLQNFVQNIFKGGFTFWEADLYLIHWLKSTTCLFASILEQSHAWCCKQSDYPIMKNVIYKTTKLNIKLEH